MLAEKISGGAGGIAIVNETDPLHIKGILGSCDATIGSRFHGLGSALSQGVPSLSTGWGHKYSRLFDDYGFGEGVVSVLDSDGFLRENINMLLDPALSASLRSKLTGRSAELKRLAEEMWALVFKEIHKKLVNTRLQYTYSLPELNLAGGKREPASINVHTVASSCSKSEILELN